MKPIIMVIDDDGLDTSGVINDGKRWNKSGSKIILERLFID